jgi:hypothetical protein
MRNVEDKIRAKYDRDAVRDAVIELAKTCEPDGQYDPDTDLWPEAAVMELIDLLGTISARDAALGMQKALWHIVDKPRKKV